MKKLTHSELSGSIFYGTIDQKKGVYTKKEEVDEKDFKIAMINYIRFREEDSNDGAIIEVCGRKFNLKAIEVREE